MITASASLKVEDEIRRRKLVLSQRGRCGNPGTDGARAGVGISVPRFFMVEGGDQVGVLSEVDDKIVPPGE
jgi:hypothetical protein